MRPAGSAIPTRRLRALALAPLPVLLLAAASGAGEAPRPAAAARAPERSEPLSEIRFVILDPGHFHAALVEKEMYPGVSRKVHVYAPLGPDLLDHLARVSRFNSRADSPTAWELELHTGPDYLERLLAERPGNALVLSGRNRGKIERLQAGLERGFHALVDKPWILEREQLESLARALDTAEQKGLVALDIMTERFEVTSELQRELVADRAVFGAPLAGSQDEPSVYMESVHHLKKTVAGLPNPRPVWFFDTAQQGEGLNDVGTHLADLVQWTLFPEQALDHRSDVRVLAAQRWATRIPNAEFKQVTGSDLPASFADRVRDGVLDYFCNTLVSYTLRGLHVTLNVIWDWEAPAGSGDTHFAYYRGSRARIEVRQGSAERFRPELYVVPSDPAERPALRAAVARRLAALQDRYPGAALADAGAELRIQVPDALRVGHEEHFAQVTARFLRYVRDRGALPAWEKPNMLAKYAVTTEGIALARSSPPREAGRRAPR